MRTTAESFTHNKSISGLPFVYKQLIVAETKTGIPSEKCLMMIVVLFISLINKFQTFECARDMASIVS